MSSKHFNCSWNRVIFLQRVRKICTRNHSDIST